MHQTTATGQDLETYMFSMDTGYTKQLAVEVAELPGGNLDNDSAYNYRKSAPELYSAETITVDGQEASEWVKNDGSEITVFIPKGGIVATLAFTTGDPTDHLQPEVSTLLKTFSWK